MIATATTSRQETLSCDTESLQEWKVTMRTSNTRTRKFSSKVGKIVMALVFASMIGGVFIAPAFGQYNERRGGYGTGGQYQHSQYGNSQYEHGRYEHGRYQHGRRVYQHRTYYSAPVYAPPLDYYVPTPSPGISLVFPILIR
jgi:hypothetical protein